MWSVPDEAVGSYKQQREVQVLYERKIKITKDRKILDKIRGFFIYYI